MKTITAYRLSGGEVVKTPVGFKPLRESYDSIIGKPFHQRILDTYYSAECSGQLKGRDNTAQYKTLAREVHRDALAQGL